MVINELIALGINQLKDLEYCNPLIETRIILAEILKVDKSYVYTYGDREVSHHVQEKFIQLVEKRATGFPIAYILNEKEFMGLDFYIEEGVLIPRPDTEILVEYVIDYINRYHSREVIKVLDIGIGSGAISLSVAKNCPNTNVFGIDIGDIPIKVSNINKKRLEILNASFYQGDLFNAIKEEKLKGQFQIIISNPPYIPKADISKLQIDVVNFEPILALDGGIDGLDFYRRITLESREYLVSGGLLIYEIGFDQAEEIKEILEKEGFKNILVLKDLQGHDRVVLGRHL